MIHLCSRSHKAVCTTGVTLVLSTPLSPNPAHCLPPGCSTNSKWVRDKSTHLRNLWQVLLVSFYFYALYPHTPFPGTTLPSATPALPSDAPQDPCVWLCPHQQGVLLPADASTTTFEGSILPWVARGCGRWQPLTKKGFCFLNQKAYGLLGGLGGTARVKPLQWNLGPHYPSLLPVLFPFS